MTWPAMGAIVSFFCNRGCKSHKHATEEAEEGSSERPWTVTRMPAIVKVCADTEGSAVVCVPWRGFVVAAMEGYRV